VSHGKHKNLLGIIRQPQFILFDYTLPLTMPAEEWHNGFAEIIKYACIMDAELFDYLEENKENALSRDVDVLKYLVEKSVAAKTKVVLEDELETGPRRWLNFGHTLGHAVEKLEHIAHGKAVAIGMVAAARFSEKLMNYPPEQTIRLIKLISDYQLPVAFTSDKEAVFDIFKLDKKTGERRDTFCIAGANRQSYHHAHTYCRTEIVTAGVVKFFLINLKADEIYICKLLYHQPPLQAPLRQILPKAPCNALWQQLCWQKVPPLSGIRVLVMTAWQHWK
jgi:3-dehydroquinate synthetase